MQTLFNYLALLILRIFSVLPYSWIVFTGDKLGWIIAHIPSERNRVVQINLRLCFPTLSDSERDALALDHWRLFARSVLERSRIWLGNPAQIAEMVLYSRSVLKNVNYEKYNKILYMSIVPMPDSNTR